MSDTVTEPKSHSYWTDTEWRAKVKKWKATIDHYVASIPPSGKLELLYLVEASEEMGRESK